MTTFARNRWSFARNAIVLATLGCAVLAAACTNDSVTAPSIASPNAPGAYKTVKISIGGLLKTMFPMAPLTRDVALSVPLVRSFTIGSKGGKIEIPETGLRIDVPSGAIPGNSLTITVTAMAGTAICYDFQPHGTVFLKPLQFKQDLDDTSWDKLDFKGTVLGGYFADLSQLTTLSGGLALLDELYPVRVDSKSASFEIRHFSGYMVSGGRQEAFSDGEF